MQLIDKNAYVLKTIVCWPSSSGNRKPLSVKSIGLNLVVMAAMSSFLNGTWMCVNVNSPRDASLPKWSKNALNVKS